MLRETNVQRLHWADKTMSVLRQEQLEACEKRLSALPDVTVFDLTDDLRTEEIWQCSHDAQEQPRMTELHTAQGLRSLVLGRLSAEAALLSIEEHLLLERLISLEGAAELISWEETSAAESLVRRMWCTITRQEGRIIVHLPKALLTPLTLTISSRAHQEIREQIIGHDAIIRAMLYIGGLLHYEVPLYHLMSDVLSGTYACDLTLALRYLRASYDYTYDRQGDMLLLHPGLADPDRLMTMRPALSGDMEIEMDEATMHGAMEGLLPEEQPLFDALYGLFAGAVRPELTEEGAVEDLLMLAKQGVSLQEMQEVLGTLLTVQPTEDMRRIVTRMHALTPRWGLISTALAQ